MTVHHSNGIKALVLASFACMALGIGAAASERLPALRVVQSGHSLTDGVVGPLETMVRVTSMRGGKLDKATIPGSPMDWRWNNASNPDIRQPEVMARYDILAITERVALSNTMNYHDSKHWALHWAGHAWEHGANGGGARSVLYASWVNIESGPGFENPYNDPEGHLTFRERLPLEMVRWQSILDHVNANRPNGMPEMEMIPGPLIMARAYDDIASGTAPGFNDINDLFSDSIHPNEMGAYLIALAHFAVIYDGDPRGLPPTGLAQGGPDKVQAAWMQEIVWDVLTEYAETSGGS